MQDNIVPFAKTNFRNQSKVFGIKTADRRNHMYVIGKTGTGKTTLLRNMMISDILAGNGVAVVDPHGEFAESILDYVPESRIKDVVYFNPADLDYPIAFNAVERVGVKERHLVSSGLISIFKKIWADSWGPRLEYVLRNAILALLEQPDSTLLGVMRILSDKEYRKKAIENVTDPVVRQFWVDEFGKYSSKFEVEAVAPIQNKVGQFLTNPMIRNIVGQQKSSIHMRQIMDEKKILIMNLSKGRVGEDSSMLMGAMLITKIQQAAMSRIDVENESDRADFYLYVDEFQNFATESFAGILSEARKYRLDLTLAHQYVAQLDEEVRDAVVGNAGTLITFRIGADDAEFFEKEFSPEIMALDLVNLPNQKIYLKLMIDGVTSRAFSANTLAPMPKPEKSFKDEIIKYSRETYGTSRIDVENEIREWSAPVEAAIAPRHQAGTAVAPGLVDAPERKEDKGDLTFYDAVCANCAKEIQVPFMPDPKRHTYCKTCLPAMKAKAAKKKEMAVERSEESLPESVAPAIPIASLGDALQGTPQKFSTQKRETDKEKKQRKGPDVMGLRDILAQSLEGMNHSPLKDAHP
ncbi:MAG: type IV secretion system DNA-binding domain-containing protein, partial [Candidatus Azambacteria bacterium]|nr:type IV secretion system DNA-binding domain-containing protein [Candidatus Azambacteria bacterium]